MIGVDLQVCKRLSATSAFHPASAPNSSHRNPVWLCIPNIRHCVQDHSHTWRITKMSSSKSLAEIYFEILDEVDRLATPSFDEESTVALTLDDILIQLRFWAGHTGDDEIELFQLLEDESKDLAIRLRHELCYLLELSKNLVQIESSTNTLALASSEDVLENMKRRLLELSRLKRTFENRRIKEQMSKVHRQWQQSKTEELFDTETVIGMNDPMATSASQSTLKISVDERPDLIKQDITPKVVTPEAKQPSSRAPAFECAECHSSLLTSADLEQHANSLSHKAYACDQTSCPETFSSNTTCYQHKETHRIGPGYQCPLCSKSFRRRDHLLEHIRSPHVDSASASSATSNRTAPEVGTTAPEVEHNALGDDSESKISSYEIEQALADRRSKESVTLLTNLFGSSILSTVVRWISGESP